MMKEIKIKDTKSIKDIEVKVWSIFNILRGEQVSSEDYDVVLFLLSIYKDNLISTDIFSERINLKEKLTVEVHRTNNVWSHQYLSIFKSFESIINHLSEEGFNSILQSLEGVDKDVLNENFAAIFDRILYRLAGSQGRRGGELLLPVELSRFMCGLVDLNDQSKVFNPFAGLASFGVYLNQGQNYFGQEINQKTQALGVLRIMAYQQSDTSQLVCEDSILNWPPPSEKFDLIIANPPFNMRLPQQYQESAHNIRTIEQFLIEKGVKSLSSNGKLIALLSQNLLFNGHEQRLRQALVEEDLLDTIISLPGGLLLNTGIPLVVLILSRDKKMPGRVRFIDAKKFVESKNGGGKVLDDSGLKSTVDGVNQEPDVVQIVKNNQIRSFDYNLSLPRYFQKKIDGIKLRKILEFVSGQRMSFPERGKLIRMKDLKDERFDFKLDILNVEETELERPGVRLIDKSCLLLAVRSKTLRPTYFQFKGEPIFISHGILAFKINESIIDIAYLINELYTEYVQEQLESYRIGSVIPFLRRDDLLEIVVKLPSLELQQAKFQGLLELSNTIKNLQAERNALAHGNEGRQFSEFASLKHTLGRPRQNILDWSDNLLHFLSTKREGFDAMNKDFQEFYDYDIISALQEIKKDINFITEVLEKGENGFVLSEYEKQIIPLTEINTVINDLSSNGFLFKIKKLLIKGDQLKERGIYGNRILFKTLLDNLLTNASKYGFEKKDIGNEVVIELTEVDDMLLMEVRNNGKPFPNNFNREKFIERFSTADSSSGTGLGGYDIDRIAIEFKNPEWELSLNEDPLYPVKFKFQLPIKLIK